MADRFIFGVAPIDYGPVLLLMPFGFHLTMDTLPSGVPLEDGFRSVLAVSGFRLRARLNFSIPAFYLRPARHYPRFRIWHPSSGRQRDFNPPEQRAAQRTLRPLLTSAPALRSPRGFLSRESATQEQISRGNFGSLQRTTVGFTLCAFDGYRLRGELPARLTLTPPIR